MKKLVVIVAGGVGTRMGNSIPKQFIELHGRPVIVYSIDAFYTAFPDIQINIVLPGPFMEEGQLIINRHFPGRAMNYIEGGKTRFDSVQNGLRLVDQPCIVFVHDAVRCLVTPSLLHRCYEAAMAYGSAIPVVPIKDSIRRITAGGSEVVDREQLRAVQTPQTFQSEILLSAFKVDFQSAFTDEASVLEHSGVPVHLVEGEASNIKITVPSDIEIAKQFLGPKLNTGS
jgi:2-C-methyl-D-erythritol 4-phosphate cytidylyltransferase